MDEYQLSVEHFMRFAQSIGIGFLIGLERERHRGKVAGLRTFTLIALAGAIGGALGIRADLHYVPWVLIVLIVASLLVAQFKSTQEEPDTTTVMAALVTFMLGYLLWLDYSLVAAALAITVTAVLYFREELRKLSTVLTRQDIASFFQFAAVAFILLPILPDQVYGPYQVINPYQIGWLVVLISGMSLLGYIALRLLRGRSGLLIVGLLGGLASTTATTLVYSRHSKLYSGFERSAAAIIMLAHLVMFVRIGIVISVVAASMLQLMLPWLLGGMLAGVVGLALLLWRASTAPQDIPEIQVKNPAELKTAFGFALLFAVVLLLSAWMHDTFQDAGGYLIAFLSGLTDVDAVTVANLKLAAAGSIDPGTAVNAVVIAVIANLLFKLAIVFSTADRKLRLPVMMMFGGLTLGMFLGLAHGAALG